MRWPRRVGLALFGIILCAGPVAAHRITGSRLETPLPLSFLFAGAGITVAVTAGWLAIPSTDFPTSLRKDVIRIQGRTVDILKTGARVIFFIAFVGAIIAGVFGPQVPIENFAIVFVWPVWLRGIGLIAAVFGSPWTFLSPWRTLYAGLVSLEGEELAVFGTYPAWLHEWPALIGFLVWIGIIENLTVVPRSPALTAGLIAGYTGLMVLGGIAFGPAWFRRADTLEVLYRIFGRVAPFQFVERAENTVLSIHTPWEDCTRPVRDIVLVGFVVATVYTVSFDGFTNIPEYQTLLFAVRDILGVGPAVSVIIYLIGFALFCASFAIIVILSDIGGRGTDWITAARAFAPTVLPIAVAYEIAHNYPYVIRNIGQTITVISGYIISTPPEIIPLAWLSLSAFWASQVLLIVGGHVVAVIASHHVSIERYNSRRQAIWAHIPFTALMIWYTVLSLWIISRPVVA